MKEVRYQQMQVGKFYKSVLFNGSLGQLLYYCKIVKGVTKVFYRDGEEIEWPACKLTKFVEVT